MAKLLVIEDDPVSLTLYSKILQKAGHTVDLAENGNRGVAQYLANTPDIVITDILMPGKDGFQTIQEIKQYDPKAKIIAISSGKQGLAKDYLEDASLIGALATLQKPFAMDILISLIEKLLKDKNTGTPPPYSEMDADNFKPEYSKDHRQETNILIFDPLTSVQKIYQKMLMTHKPFRNFIFSSVENLEDALKQLKNAAPQLIIMEWLFENQDSPKKFLFTLRNKLGYKHIPVFVCSRENQKKAIVEAFQCGASDYIVKPILRNILIHKVEKALKNSKPVKVGSL